MALHGELRFEHGARAEHSWSIYWRRKRAAERRSNQKMGSALHVSERCYALRYAVASGCSELAILLRGIRRS